jgi:hypothetical protein
MATNRWGVAAVGESMPSLVPAQVRDQTISAFPRTSVATSVVPYSPPKHHRVKSHVSPDTRPG